jgi:hypothetical protein
VAEIAMDVFVLIVLLMSSRLPQAVSSAIYQHVWWFIVVLSAPAGVTMLLIVPGVLSAYGVLDFARVRFSLGCCVLLFFSFAWVLLLLIVGVVGGWFIVMADMYMLVALCGVPHHKLLGNKLNMGAYTTLRFMCQGLLQALPSALISTAAIDVLLVTDAHPRSPFGQHVKIVYWASLLLSMSRFAWEVFSLAALTHKMRAPCFVTAIVDLVHHLQPQQASDSCDRPHDSHSAQAGLASLLPVETPASGGPQAALTGSKGAPSEQAAPYVPAEPAAEGAAAGPVSMQAAVQMHGSSSAVEGVSCCSSWGGRACWPQQYPKFTVVYVWVVAVLAGAFVCVVCSHFIWPWLVLDMLESDSFEPLPAESVRPYSLLGLWGNWKLSGSVKGSLKALGGCDLQYITCNLTAPSYASNGAGVGTWLGM